MPAVVLEGALDLDEALVLDGVEDSELLERAHAAGTPVVVRAVDVSGIARALARPEVACVLVTDPGLLELDLTELTYG